MVKKIFKNKYTPIVIGLVIIGLVLYFFLCLNGSRANLTAMISITDDGFIPSQLTVQKGTKLIFVSNGKNLHWPASNFHPTHELYPDGDGCIGSKFDSCRGLKSGETFEYTVEIVGKWPLHDHLYPGQVMILEVVKDKNKTDFKKLFSSIFSPNNLPEMPSPEEFRSLDYGRQLEIMQEAANKNPVKSWDYIKNTAQVNGKVVINAHEFSHIIGNMMYLKYGLEGITNCDDTFAFGCYHGVSEKMMEQEGASVVTKVQDQCIKIYPPEESIKYTGCIHGMGHGLLSFENLDVSKALEDCDQLNDPFRNYCYDGVFMENSPNAAKDLDINDPWKFCNNLDEGYHYNCARYQAQTFIEKFNKNDIKTITLYCSKTSQETLRRTCFQGIGFSVSQTTLGDYDKIKSLCLKAVNTEGRDFCMIGAAKEALFQRYENAEVVSVRLCQELKGEELIDRCIKDAEDVKKGFN